MDDRPTIILNLPTPPSLNKLWRTGVGKARIRSREYSEWVRTAGWTARTQLVGAPTIVGTFRALITLPERSRIDRDNATKAIFDLLQHVHAVRNDSGLRDYTVTAAERDDVLVLLWDTGGPEQREPKVYRAGRTAPKRVTAAQIARFERARRLM